MFLLCGCMGISAPWLLIHSGLVSFTITLSVVDILGCFNVVVYVQNTMIRLIFVVVFVLVGSLVI